MAHWSANAPQPMTSNTSPSGPRYHVGVLLVHGMGEQPEGDTLLAFGEPIVRWLRRWFASSPAHPDQLAIEEVRTSLHPARELRAEPAHAELKVRALDNCGQPVEQRWLMAESWWGGDVQRPPFSKLAFWMLTIGAWVVFSHFGKHRRFGTIGGDARAILVSLFVSLPVALVFQAMVLALSILAALPIPALRKSLSAFLLAMTGVLGDAYVLLENPLQRAAIAERARRSLRWLADDCAAVIVLAHSQGAAVAHDALRQAAPKNVKALLTFGSGLEKLTQIQAAQRTGAAGGMAVAAPLLAGLLALLTPAATHFRDDVAQGVLDWRGLFWMGLILIATFAVGAFAALYGTMRNYWVAHAHQENEKLFGPLGALIERKHWVDVFSTCDVVPNGALYRPESSPGPYSVEIVNRRALLDDHTTYWDNNAEFLPLVANMLGGVAGLRIIEPVDHSAMNAAVDRYRRCVRWLQINRWAVGAALMAAATLFLPDQLRRWGELTQGALRRIPLGLEPLATGLAGFVATIADWACHRLHVERVYDKETVLVSLKTVFGPIWLLWARETSWQALVDKRRTSTQASTVSPAAVGNARPTDQGEAAGSSSIARKLPLPDRADTAVFIFSIAPLLAILVWHFSVVGQVWTWMLRGAGAAYLLTILIMMITALAVLKPDFRALWTSRGRGSEHWVRIVGGLTFVAIFVSFSLGFGLRLSDEIAMAPFYAMVVLLLVIGMVLWWANLLGRFAGAAWKVLAVGIPLALAGLLTIPSLHASKVHEGSGLIGGPILGGAMGLGLVWLIARMARGRVPGVQGTDASSPGSSAPPGREAPSGLELP
jgi:hypothetical protein